MITRVLNHLKTTSDEAAQEQLWHDLLGKNISKNTEIAIKIA